MRQVMNRIRSEWQVSMPLPKLDLADQYSRILRALGHETMAPEAVQDGWVIRWKKPA